VLSRWWFYFPLAFLAATVLVLWFLTSAALALIFASFTLLIYLIHHLRNLHALNKWLQNPEPSQTPQGSWGWGSSFDTLYRLIQAQTQSRRELSGMLGRFEQAAQAMPDGIILLNDSNQIEWCNPVAEQQFGLVEKRDHGQPVHHLLRQPQFVEYLNTQNFSEPLILKPPINSEQVLSIQLVPFGDKQKLMISRDITQLERVDAMRRDFIANVSHELRTPLTVVGGFLETLSDVPSMDTQQRHHYLSLMAEQTSRMQRLVQDLLTLSRLESSSDPRQEKPVNMPVLMDSLLKETQELSAGRHLIDLKLDSYQWLSGNEDELRSAFGNLLSNAVRYTPPDGVITLSWSVNKNCGVVSVRDSGEGIEVQHIPRLTERFYRVDRSRSRETGGTGLGLSIVKHVLTRHQATLEIDSTPGKGSIFSAYFPANRLLGVGAPARDKQDSFPA
jgi:two-component system phosphate regulon sensor histidine kinase PhoR